MSGQNPDPEEDKITGLEPGGGVPPGETPPAESSVGGPQGHEEDAPGKAASRIWLVVIGIIVLLGLLYFVGYIVGLFN